MKHRMNSVKAKTFGYANTEPSRSYTDGRCRDYRSGSVHLMTGESVLPSNEVKI